ncbi:MAG: metallophosphatase family protein [Candidatus Omnitrophica bacterium]|nr:metallophosphatase family protein [Candidatus Omnitrophota bacterium]MCF7909056.1 metallophosphatase family protein [Candidatus Omnitrophota bacterium]
MRYGIFSDIHSNLEAFSEAVNYFNGRKIDRFICLGDIVGYGPDPQQCLEVVKKLKSKTIAGNHDWATVGKFNLNYFNWCAQKALSWTQKKINEKGWKYLHGLPLIYKKNNFYCVHGSLDKPKNFNYTITPSQVQLNFSLLDARLCFIGHSHITEVFCLNKGQIKHLRKEKINIEKDKKYIINVGSIGQPRDGDPRLSLCVYDTDKQLLTFKRIEYNIKKTADKIIKKKLPEFLAKRLYLGR